MLYIIRLMGVKGFKIDFIDRDDQKMVKSLYQIAQKAADNHLLVDYHGMYKPSSLQRTYPNVVNFEGVKGLENMKSGTTDQPVYDVTIPFIRMVSGPMDYTSGGMRNATKDSYRPVNSNPMTQGSYRATFFADGINANKDATDYKKTVTTVTANDKLSISLASGGGWAARFEKIK